MLIRYNSDHHPDTRYDRSGNLSVVDLAVPKAAIYPHKILSNETQSPTRRFTDPMNRVNPYPVTGLRPDQLQKLLVSPLSSLLYRLGKISSRSALKFSSYSVHRPTYTHTHTDRTNLSHNLYHLVGREYRFRPLVQKIDR